MMRTPRQIATMAFLVLAPILVAYYWQQFNQECISDPEIVLDGFVLPPCEVFSDTYLQARRRFRTAAQLLNITIQSQEAYVDAAGRDYTMDIAVILGKQPGLVLHVSGVHGIEGYAGSAVQVAFLQHQKFLQQQRNPGQLDWSDLPTIVMVHALNPYGMAHDRRWNENNVDLNRNALTPAQWQRAKDHPNRATYDQFSDHLFNQPYAPTWYNVYIRAWVLAVYHIARYGLTNLKAALVGGQYHFQRGIFYGGDSNQAQPEASIRILCDWLQSQDYASSPSDAVTWIDVHTGLGPLGHDTLLKDLQQSTASTESTHQSLNLSHWFPGASHSEDSQTTSTQVTAGYELSMGMVGDYMRDVIFAGHGLFVSQEFGTRPNVLVAHALFTENAAHWYAPGPVARDWAYHTTRRVFYPAHVSWRRQVLERGLVVLNQGIQRSLTLGRDVASMKVASESSSPDR